MFNYDEILIDGQEENISIFNDSDLNILLEKELIKKYNDKFYPLFVGELITPNKTYFSLPKNFKKTQENINLTKNLIKKYRELRDEQGKLLLTNTTFSVQKDGKIESDKFFFTELKSFFLDFITYEFIYPKKEKEIHSYKPIRGGKIDILNTIKNQSRYGIGTTYKTKDIINTDEWNLDDIYYHTLIELCERYGTKEGAKNDLKDIEEMKNYLISEGYIIKPLKLIDDNDIIKNINKCDIGIIHQPIKNTLLNYYKSKKIGEHYSINIFYTKKFELIWEYIVKIVLKNNELFRKEVIDSSSAPIKSTFVSNKQNSDKIEEYRKLIPDIFSEWDDKKFIGDAKYYTNYDSHFDKEMYVYNELIKNKYPMVVFIPTDKVIRRYDRRIHNDFEIIIILLSSSDVLLDLINNTDRVIKRVHTLVGKNTNRWIKYE